MPTIKKVMHMGTEYCFDASGCKTGYIDVLVVGGGGAGGGSYQSWVTPSSAVGSGNPGGGGGGGQVCSSNCLPIQNCITCWPITVGGGGPAKPSTYDYICCQYYGCCSTGFGFIAYGGGAGASRDAYNNLTCGPYIQNANGNAGGAVNACGGGAGVLSNISGQNIRYGVGGGKGGGMGCPGYQRTDGAFGGRGVCTTDYSIKGCPGCPATTYGGGGGGAGEPGKYCSCCGRQGSTSMGGGAGCQGVVYVRYKTDGSYGILPTSSGGTKYTCGDYTIHRFTNTATTEYFRPVFK